MSDLIRRIREYEADHGPLGWPAVQMQFLSDCKGEIERLTAELAAARETARRLMAAERVLTDERDAARALFARVLEADEGDNVLGSDLADAIRAIGEGR